MDRFIENCGTMAELKNELRRALRKQRREQDELAARAGSAAVCERVIALPEYPGAELILAYMAAKGEVDVSYIVDDAMKRQKKIACPLCAENGGLRLMVPNTTDSFKLGAYGIMEPDIDDSVEVDASELDLIIVPAVAYMRDCSRLGQGGGYYDRLLVKTSAFTVGVGYDFQLIDWLPVEPHDRPLNCVALPSELIRR